MTIDVLCALDSISRGRELKRRLEPNNVILAASASEIDAALRTRMPDLVVAGTRIVEPPIEDWVREVRDHPWNPDVVLVHDPEDARFRAAAIRAGCLAVLGGTLPIEDLTATLQALIERRLGLMALLHVRSPTGDSRLRDFVSQSPGMQQLIGVARKVVDTDSSLLLLGETGVGKERLARAIHNEGPRSAGPFVAVNCGALPDTLVESELFGHEKGAFTGASRTRKGYFEQADRGTLFLDEIDEIPLHLQVKLLRAVEDRRVQRLGGERTIPVDVRIVAASNRDLEQAVEAGRLREDLYYRLAVVSLEVPPLRERVEDIPLLLQRYRESFRRTLNRPIHGLQKPALEALLRYRWPGNVRELINVVERAVLLSPGPEIRLADLPRAISSLDPGASASHPPGPPLPGEALSPWVGEPLLDAREQVVGEFESRYLSHLLRETGGRIHETARRAGINERSLYELMRRHGLRKEHFRLHRARND